MGIKPDDAPYLRRLCIQMASAGYGDISYFMLLPLEEFTEIVNEIGKIAKERRNKRRLR